MSYIGKTPQIGGYHKLDSITCDGSTAYTMQLNSSNFSPESANHLIVSVNGVIQAPTDSFTVSGSTITFASSLSASDTIDFIMALGNTLDIGTPSDGTISASKLATTSITGQTSEATANDADSILIYDDSATALRKMTRANFLSGVGGTNTPNWSAQLTSAQSGLGAGSIVKIQFNNEIFDSDGAYDTSNYRFTVPSGQAGKYFINAGLCFTSSTNARSTYCFIYKNGGGITQSGYFLTSQYFQNDQYCVATSSTIMSLSEGDYIEIYGSRYDGTSQTVAAGGVTYFNGFKLI